MNDGAIGWVIALFFSLCLPMIVLAACGIWRAWRMRHFVDAEESRGRLGLLGITGLLLLSVLIVRGTVDLYVNCHPEVRLQELGDAEDQDPEAGMNWFEVLADAFNHTLQTFSMDEGYTETVQQSKKVVRHLLPGTVSEAAKDGWAATVGAYIALQNIVAPVLGGAVVLELISSLVPSFHAFWLNLLFWKKKYYFSQLDERSLTLAKNIRKDKTEKSSVLIFLKTKGGDEEEENTLKKRAQAIHAVCLEADIRYYCPWVATKKNYVLMNEDSDVNLTSFASIIKQENLSRLKKSTIHLIYLKDCFLAEEYSIFSEVRRHAFEERYHENETAALNDLLKKERTTDRIGRLKSQLEGILAEHDKLVGRGASRVTQSELDAIVNMPLKKIDKRYGVWRGEVRQKDGREKGRDKILEFQKDITVCEWFNMKYKITLNRVSCYQQLARDVLRRVPLYIPAKDDIPKESKDFEKPLRVSILGSGDIGTEMFLNTTWMGQILEMPLEINVVSEESRERFTGRLDYLNPEILRSSTEGDPLLRWDIGTGKGGMFNPPYFTFRYSEKDVTSASLDGILCTKTEIDSEPTKLLESDYFIVALGSDSKNVLLVQELKRQLIIKRKKEEKNSPEHKVIVCFVYDSDLNEKLKKEEHMESGDLKLDIYIEGGLNKQYPAALLTGMREKKDNAETKASSTREQEVGKSLENYLKAYDGDSDAAREIHLGTKYYSAYRFLTRKKLESQSVPGGKEREDCIRWIEKRRWNAYMRSIGFQNDPDPAAGKDMILRTHNCLVERNLPGSTTPDKLDVVSEASGVKNGEGGYKLYDEESVMKEDLEKATDTKSIIALKGKAFSESVKI